MEKGQVHTVRKACMTRNIVVTIFGEYNLPQYCSCHFNWSVLSSMWATEGWELTMFLLKGWAHGDSVE